jgi:hypothetical protein
LTYKANINRPKDPIYQDPKPYLNNFFSVFSAGIFFVPHIEKREPFPGSDIFFGSGNNPLTYK